MLTPGQVDRLQKRGKRLGEGQFSTASKIRWQGADAVLKTPTRQLDLQRFV